MLFVTHARKDGKFKTFLGSTVLKLNFIWFGKSFSCIFVGKHGWVQYFCKTALREATGLSHKNQQVFIVMNPIDLNMEPAILAVRYIYFFKKGKSNKETETVDNQPLIKVDIR
jgi:hypothetical protein